MINKEDLVKKEMLNKKSKQVLNIEKILIINI